VLQYGNSLILSQYLKKLMGKEEVKIVSFGEHLYDDMLACSKFREKSKVTWDTIALVQEFSLANPDHDEATKMGVINH
jgi:hypothetical protein